MATVSYVDAKARVVRALARVTTFLRASNDFTRDEENVNKRAKISQMLSELNNIRQCVEDDIQVMESAVGQDLAPTGVADNSCSNSLIDSFYDMYYDLAAFACVHSFPMNSKADVSMAPFSTMNNSSNMKNSSTFQLPKRKFPTFSGKIVEWQGFEDLFTSILSHVPELPDVERFEYLKTSLEGDALKLISHLTLTAANYESAWSILRARYGNKRDLARIHFDALLTTHVVKCDDALSIQKAINTILEHTAALDNLQFTTRQWGPLIIHIFEKQLDYELRARWEQTIGEKHNPQLPEFVEFLRNHVRSAEVRQAGRASQNQIFKSGTGNKGSLLTPSRFRPSSTATHKVLATTTTQPVATKCPLCPATHSIRQCQLFLEKKPNDRFQVVKTHQLCLNCLGAGHNSAACTSKYKCHTCKRTHHTLLHFETKPGPTEGSVASTTMPNSKASTTSLIVRGHPRQVVLLATVLLDAYDADGRRHGLRAILDCGSQASFITEAAACMLRLRRRHSPVQVSTFGNTTTASVRGKCTISVVPVGQQAAVLQLDVSIIPQITGLTPQTPVVSGEWDHIRPLSLADPSYHTPGPIDLLLGADILPSIYLDGMYSGRAGEPVAMNTVFGWVLIGPTESNVHSSVTSLYLSVSDPLDVTLKRFWEVEELPTTPHFSSDDRAAEDFYQATTTRSESGRFMVAIPFRKPLPLLGNSKMVALQRFKALERRLDGNTDLRKQYAEFMEDYLSAGHMELIPPTEINNSYHYYIPHHCVLRPDSLTTKLRVVFNASATTAAGVSLNESMYTGPKLQPDIQIVLLRARLWKYLFMADIKQMYRQILVRPADRDYLRILWRFSSSKPIDEYRLCTVTYGTSAAPFQALRTVRELAHVDGAAWPLAASVLLNDTFVDDVLTGANSTHDALECQKQLISLCSLAQFELRKWASNNSQILEAVPEEARAMSPSVLFESKDHSELKVLGLRWDPVTDMFSFKSQSSTDAPTKRSILSDIARIFDPIGLLSPLTFWTKHLIQQLWTAGLKWDDPLPLDLAEAWSRYQSELHQIENLTIPRRLTYDQTVSLQLHAFSDSSEKGYAAAVYLRVETTTSVHCALIAGKSKVAPLKRCTIPRLELCGAVLAAKLLNLVVTTYNNRIDIEEQHAWTDSTTALVWIRSSPHRWPTFIANRTSQIQTLTSPSIWRHVPTRFNPVDCASRGLFPEELRVHPLWWTGPSYLLESPDKWPMSPVNLPDESSLSTQHEYRQTVLLVKGATPIEDLMNRHSSLEKILRIIAYCLRVKCLRSVLPQTTFIGADEFSHALDALIYVVQRAVYAKEIASLSAGRSIQSNNLRRLDPFIDETGLVRVGGRLNNADIPYKHRHPVLLPSRHRFTDLLIDYHHSRLKHSGATALQAHLQREFWIQSARRSIRSRLRLCVPCFRTRPVHTEPKMAPLPKFRVQQVKPFAITGVDYAGPISLKGTRNRQSPSRTAYICLFVCMATKAIHLELSTDLTTECFLLAFTRFVARRGPVTEMHSDCGTNFVGAAHLMTPLNALVQSTSFQQRVQNRLATSQISWHFNPPSSPHFGGLWEAGVKSTKALMLRTIGVHKLTAEELYTLLTQIEATLNSRPLCALSNDPTDLEALTPSHFLTLEPSTSLPNPNLMSVPLSKLQRWRLVNDLQQHFWSRWKNEYLSSLQVRTKWSKDSQKLRVGDLVLIREATRPLTWRLGRIHALHPGADGIARVASIDTQTGRFTRPVVKLCPLPTC